MVVAVLWITWLFGMLFYAPRTEKLLKDFNMKVPAFTQWVLAASRWLGAYWYILLAPLLFLLAVAGAVDYVLRREPRTRRLCWLWFGLMLALPLALILCSLLGLWLPVLKLQEGLSR
jgi:type II secretory pathway component PulF